jgi:hypothetical protein
MAAAAPALRAAGSGHVPAQAHANQRDEQRSAPQEQRRGGESARGGHRDKVRRSHSDRALDPDAVRGDPVAPRMTCGDADRMVTGWYRSSRTGRTASGSGGRVRTPWNSCHTSWASYCAVTVVAPE